MKKQVLYAVVLGGLTALFMFAYISKVQMDYSRGAEKATVLVAKQYVDQTVLLDSTMFIEKKVPKDYIQPRAIESLKDLINEEGNSVFMSIVPIEEGEQLVATKLLMLGVETGIAAVTPSNMRAVTLTNINDSVKMIKPGNRVDVVLTFEYDDKDGNSSEVTSTILQNVLVLAVGNQIIGGMQISLGKDKKNVVSAQGLNNIETISLAVSPSDGEKLALASEKGEITFSLRPIGDEQIYESKGVQMSDLVGNINITSGSGGNKGHGSSESNDYLKMVQKQQAEAMKLLQKYKKQ
ncbi:MAG: Flp pilus assembly protein CpaB [Elusimicrobiota bacterium]